MKYPFVPKSTKYLLPGQFWAIPLKNGKFCCGRVIQLHKKNRRTDKRIFLCGLLNWVDKNPPTFESIAGAKTIEQGSVHIKTIIETGGKILGHRPLELDEIEPKIFLSQSPGQGCMLMYGYDRIRPAKTEEYKKYKVFSTWGYKVIEILAEKYFG